jgi:hypothetical protein
MELALGTASLVLLAGGLTAVIRRAMTPGRALQVLVIAVGVGALSWAVETLDHGRHLGAFYVFLVIASMTVAGIAATIAVLSKP